MRAILLDTERPLTRELLLSFYDYDPESGIFTHRADRAGREAQHRGRKAGSVGADGYTRLFVRNVRYPAHRLAWLASYGNLPVGEIDHINGQRSDNRIANLRLVNRSQNHQNRKGVRGAAMDSGRWTARIGVDGKSIYLGRFDTEEEARAAYLKAKRVYHPTAPDRRAI